MENERFNRQNSQPNDAAERNNSELNRGNQETTNTLHSAVTASLGSQTEVKSPYSRQVKDGTFLSEKADHETYSSGYVYVRTGSKSSLTSQTKRKSLLQQSLGDINTSSCNFPSSENTTQLFSNGYIDVRTGSERPLTSKTKRKSLLFRRHSLHDINTRSPAFPSSFGSLSYSKADSNSYADVNSVDEISHSRLSVEYNMYESIGSGLNQSIVQTDLNSHEDVISGSEILQPLLPAESNVYESIGSGLNDSIRPIDSTPHDNVNPGSQIEHSCPPAGASNDRRGCSKKQMTLVIVLLVTLIVTSLGVNIWKILETNDGLHMHVPPKELTASQRIFHPNESVSKNPVFGYRLRSGIRDDRFVVECQRNLKTASKQLFFREGLIWMLNSTFDELFDVSLPGTVDFCDGFIVACILNYGIEHFYDLICVDNLKSSTSSHIEHVLLTAMSRYIRVTSLILSSYNVTQRLPQHIRRPFYITI